MKTVLVMRQMLDLVVSETATQQLVPALASAHTSWHTFTHNYLVEYLGDVISLAMLLGYTLQDNKRIYSQPSIEQLTTCVEQLRLDAYKD